MRIKNAEIEFLQFEEYNTLIGSLADNILFKTLIEILIVKRFYFEQLDLTDAISEISHVLMRCEPLNLSSKKHLNDFAHYLLLSVPTLKLIITIDTINHMPVD